MIGIRTDPVLRPIRVARTTDSPQSAASLHGHALAGPSPDGRSPGSDSTRSTGLHENTTALTQLLYSLHQNDQTFGENMTAVHDRVQQLEASAEILSSLCETNRSHSTARAREALDFKLMHETHRALIRQLFRTTDEQNKQIASLSTKVAHLEAVLRYFGDGSPDRTNTERPD